LPQFADLALQRLTLSATSVGTPPRLPLSTSAFFTHSCSVCGTQPIFSAIDTTVRPSGRVITLMIENHPYRPLADFGRKLVRRLARHGSTFSGVGASDKPGAVQSDEMSRVCVAWHATYLGDENTYDNVLYRM
jgi:hypothetical protein